VELNHFAPPPALAKITADARAVRSYGCASAALSLVARGATDAHIDIRGRVTAESYLAGARLLLEAGGYVATLDGTPLPAERDLTDGMCLIATSSRELCNEIVDRLSSYGG
jgi:fructose-1,6-bisphosphatase/inositol monophosphatase family enzyme